jgi:hypothetical protein
VSVNRWSDLAWLADFGFVDGAAHELAVWALDKVDTTLAAGPLHGFERRPVMFAACTARLAFLPGSTSHALIRRLTMTATYTTGLAFLRSHGFQFYWRWRSWLSANANCYFMSLSYFFRVFCMVPAIVNSQSPSAFKRTGAAFTHFL